MNVPSRLSAIVRTIASWSAAAVVVFLAACVAVSRVDVNRAYGIVAIGGSVSLPPARQWRFSLLDDGDLLLNYVTAEGTQRSSWYRFERSEKVRTSASK